MMREMATAFEECAASSETKVVILTGADPYYCAGVNLSDAMQP
jgi:enoyl-CoA hydratase/carnithine racemase